MGSVNIQLTVNGSAQVVSSEPDTPLLDVLRHDLGLAGPRFGCGIGLCGACFVLIDGQARSSCDFPAWAAEGKEVTTVEGLAMKGAGEAGGGELHAVQQAVIDEQAAQCGYCTAGMIMSGVALLHRNPAPTEREVRAALDGNLCRCGTHQRIVRAVLRAAARTAPAGAAE
jgi:nicotinate dehydrogenase subunit A